MAAVMIVMMVFMLMGPHHGYMASTPATPPTAEASVPQVDRAARPDE